MNINAIADLFVGCSILLFDALRNEMKSLIGRAYLDNRNAVIVVACTSYQSGGYNTEESTRLHHFCHRYIIVYIPGLDCGSIRGSFGETVYLVKLAKMNWLNDCIMVVDVSGFC